MMRASGLGAQAWSYSRVPALAPLIAGLALSIAALSIGVLAGAVMLSLFIAALALMMIHPATRRLFGLLIVIERARRAERAESLSASWETARA